MTIRNFALALLLLLTATNTFADCTDTISLQDNQWNQISLPCAPPAGASTAGAILEDDMGANAIYGDNWALYAYDPGSNSYSAIEPNDNMTAGTGYWIFNGTGSTRTLSLPAGSQPVAPVNSPECPTVASNCIDTPLNYSAERVGESQYNLVGIPSANAFLWRDVQVADNQACSASNGSGTGCTLADADANNVFQSTAWQYTGTEYSEVINGSTISSWNGLWVRLLPNAQPNSNLRLLLPADSSGGGGGADGIIFESDFSNDSGYSVQGIDLWNGGSNINVPLPEGWDGVKAGGSSRLTVVQGAGVNGGNAMKFEWDPNASQPVVSLAKHLTDNESTGYNELYIRYHVKLPNRFMAGNNGAGTDYWKWGRLWQNTSPTNSSPNKWTENRVNAGFVVWNFTNNQPYTMASATWAASQGAGLALGSAGGPRYKVDFYNSPGWNPETSPGAFESFWDLNDNSRPGTLENNTSQRYHTLEYHFKLATSTGAANGEFEMWWDGVSQGQFQRVRAQGGASQSNGIPTPVSGSGFNFFVLFDNLSGWNARWSDSSVDGFVYLNDVVISENYIGPNYRVGSNAN